MEDGGTLRCNGCWTACDNSQPSVATACQHLYCLSCCQTILESDDPTCPICSQASGAGTGCLESCLPALLLRIAVER